MPLNESIVADAVLMWFRKLGCLVGHGPHPAGHAAAEAAERGVERGGGGKAGGGKNMNASSPIPMGLQPTAQPGWGRLVPSRYGRFARYGDEPSPPRFSGRVIPFDGIFGRLRSKRASSPLPSPPWHGGEGDLLAYGQLGGLAEGSRWSFRAQGETTTGKPRRMAEHPGGVPDPARTCDSVARSNWFGRDESSTPCRGADICCAITRRPPPPSPAATSGCPLATLRVDPAGMSKLHGALGQRALPPNASRISIAALPRFA
jgi:hypothetical protein